MAIEVLADFAERYADLDERDFTAHADAIADGPTRVGCTA
jgi:hypothetical protein